MRELLKRSDGVISLLAIFGIGIFALSASLAIAVGTAADLAKNRNAVQGDQSFYTAESGTFEGALQYRNATSSYTGGTPDLLNGTSEGGINVTDMGWPYVKIKSNAKGASANRIVSNIITVFPEGSAFDYAVYANHDLNIGGSTEINGGIFANDNVDFTGENSDINGNAYSAATIDTSHDNIDGEIFEGVDKVPPPEIIDTPYREAAIAGETYFATSTQAATYLKNQTREAVVFVEDTGLTKIQDTVLTGSLYIKGDLQITSSGTFTATGTYAVIVVEGNLSVKGTITINGIVYVKGSTAFGAGNQTINGSLISAGGVSSTDLNGHTTINFDPVVTANWQNLAGLDTTTDTAPEVVEWGEE